MLRDSDAKPAASGDRAQHGGLHFSRLMWRRGRRKSTRARLPAEEEHVESLPFSVSRARNVVCTTHTRDETNAKEKLTVVAYRLPTVARGVVRRRHPKPLHVSPPVRCRCRRTVLPFATRRPGRTAVSSLLRSLATRDARITIDADNESVTLARDRSRARSSFADVRLRDAKRHCARRVAGRTRPARRYLHAEWRDGVGVRAVTGVGTTVASERERVERGGEGSAGVSMGRRIGVRCPGERNDRSVCLLALPEMFTRSKMYVSFKPACLFFFFYIRTNVLPKID